MFSLGEGEMIALASKEATRIETKLASLNVYLPWDGTASLPGPWEFWNQQIKALGRIYSQLQKNYNSIQIYQMQRGV